jgi:hypothetical protein
MRISGMQRGLVMSTTIWMDEAARRLVFFGVIAMGRCGKVVARTTTQDGKNNQLVALCRRLLEIFGMGQGMSGTFRKQSLDREMR